LKKFGGTAPMSRLPRQLRTCQQYTAQGRAAILAELARRGIPDPTQVVHANHVTVTAEATSMSKVRANQSRNCGTMRLRI
jgi:hypothetical protein